MYKRIKAEKTSARRNESIEGETIEMKINRIVNNKEPIKDGAPIIFTERKDGVLPSYDIRTDRFEIAVEAMDKVNKTHIAKRENLLKEMADKEKGDKKEDKPNTGGESVQGDVKTT